MAEFVRDLEQLFFCCYSLSACVFFHHNIVDRGIQPLVLMAFTSYSTKPLKANVIAVAIFFGILAGFGLSTIGSFGPPLKSSQEPFPTSIVIIPDDGPATSPPPADAEWELKKLQDMVARTNGFYARDYSLWLGWNNVCAAE